MAESLTKHQRLKATAAKPWFRFPVVVYRGNFVTKKTASLSKYFRD